VFAEFNVSAGAAICFLNIPPCTLAIFKPIPTAWLTTQDVTGGGDVSLLGDWLTAGLDGRYHSMTLNVMPSQWGTFSYFAMTFPTDWWVRIVSILPQDVFVHSVSTEKMCHFSGRVKKV
jgi:hypothetical protein